MAMAVIYFSTNRPIVRALAKESKPTQDDSTY